MSVTLLNKLMNNGKAISKYKLFTRATGVLLGQSLLKSITLVRGIKN